MSKLVLLSIPGLGFSKLLSRQSSSPKVVTVFPRSCHNTMENLNGNSARFKKLVEEREELVRQGKITQFSRVDWGDFIVYTTEFSSKNDRNSWLKRTKLYENEVNQRAYYLTRFLIA